jgi:hypothetical protein
MESRLSKFLAIAAFVSFAWIPLNASYAFSQTDDETSLDIAAKRAEVEKEFRHDPQQLDEIIVDAKREKLSKLHAEMVKTESELYASFNTLNTDPEYETTCHEETDVHTRMQARVCTPKFVDSALEVYGQALARGVAFGRLSEQFPLDPAITIDSKMPAYRKHFLDAVQADPKMKKLSSEYYALYKHYQALRKAKFKGVKWFVFD